MVSLTRPRSLVRRTAPPSQCLRLISTAKWFASAALSVLRARQIRTSKSGANSCVWAPAGSWRLQSKSSVQERWEPGIINLPSPGKRRTFLLKGLRTRLPGCHKRAAKSPFLPVLGPFVGAGPQLSLMGQSKPAQRGLTSPQKCILFFRKQSRTSLPGTVASVPRRKRAPGPVNDTEGMSSARWLGLDRSPRYF